MGGRSGDAGSMLDAVGVHRRQLAIGLRDLFGADADHRLARPLSILFHSPVVPAENILARRQWPQWELALRLRTINIHSDWRFPVIQIDKKTCQIHLLTGNKQLLKQ